MSEYEDVTDCPTCPMLATDRDNALNEARDAQEQSDRWEHLARVINKQAEAWQGMAEDLWEELQEWHTQKCAKYGMGIVGAECVCHRILAAKWDELAGGPT